MHLWLAEIWLTESKPLGVPCIPSLAAEGPGPRAVCADGLWVTLVHPANSTMESLCPIWPSQRGNLDLVRLCSWLTFPFFVLYNLFYHTAMTLKRPGLGALFSSLLLLKGELGFCEREIRIGRDSCPFSVRREVADGELLCLIKKSPDKATGMPETTGFPWITEPLSFCCEMVFLACSCGSESTAPACTPIPLEQHSESAQ